mgnify:CR=1 FL=1
MPSNVLPLHLKQTWIFTEGEGDGIESRVPFKIYSTLLTIWTSETQKQKTLLITLITLNYRKMTLIYIAENNDSIRYLEQQRLCETLLSEMTFETYTDDNRQFTDF